MMPHTTTPLADSIAQLQQQLGEFRAAHPVRTKLPESLWQSAVELARQHGVYTVAHPLRLDYTRLKERLGESSGRRRKTTKPAFVELIAPERGRSSPGTSLECRVELEGRRGKMRIEFKGIATAELVALGRALWDGEA